MKRMLIDAAHPEETRVAVLDGNQLEEFDVESASRKQLKGNIYLAKVTRVEPSLQAAFVDYGGNRHGFLAFNEIHPDYYQIPVADRERLIAEQEAEDAEEEEREEAERDAAAEAADAGIEPAHDIIEPEPLIEVGGAQDLPFDGEPESTSSEGGPSPEAIESEPAVERTQELSVAPAESVSVEPSEAVDVVAERVDEPTAEIVEIEDTEPARAHRPVETVGGDELDEAAARRRPPQRALRRYKIQEVIKRRQILLVQVVKEERGNKGAALTTYLSLAGRYCVLMPNTGKGGGISRKIGGGQDRKRLKSIISDLEVPHGMAMIVRTAGADRGKAEIKRDYEYLLRLWNDIRNLTLKSTAPALINGEANIINRAIRDLYTRDIDEIVVEGDEAYRNAKDLMKMLIPSHAKKVQAYKDDSVPLFSHYRIENQLESMNSPTVQLKSGGYIVMNATEALVAIDVNSGRATRGRNIEETALRTNTEAATEIARQLRLRDLAGLIVIDFIDMDHTRNQVAVERRLKEAMRRDRARIQIGRISPFGLLELSRQRLRPSLAETVSDICPHCGGTGVLRSTESTALHVLRGIEEEAMKRRARELTVKMPTSVALYLLNHKRAHLTEMESKFETQIVIEGDDSLIPPKFTIERSHGIHVEGGDEAEDRPARPERPTHPERSERNDREPRGEREQRSEGGRRDEGEREGGDERRRRRRRGRRRGNENEARDDAPMPADTRSAIEEDDEESVEEYGDFDAGERSSGERPDAGAVSGDGEAAGEQARRRRGRRGGRGRNRRRDEQRPLPERTLDAADAASDDDADGAETQGDTRRQDGEQPGGERRRRRRVRRRRPRTDAAPTGPSEAMSNEPEGLFERAPVENAADEPSRDAARADEPAEETTPRAEEPKSSYTRPEPEPQPSYAAPAEPATVRDEEPSGPPRRGWWQKLME